MALQHFLPVNLYATPTALLSQIAKRQAVVNPENTFFSVKRFIGRRMTEVGSEMTQVPYQVHTNAM